MQNGPAVLGAARQLLHEACDDRSYAGADVTPTYVARVYLERRGLALAQVRDAQRRTLCILLFLVHTR